MWCGRAPLLVLVITALVTDCDNAVSSSNIADNETQLRVGHSINIFTRYGYLSISMKVVARNESDQEWIFREPTVDVFADVVPITNHPTRSPKKSVFDGDFHLEFCDNLKQLLQAYFRDYSFEMLDRPWRAFSGSWQPDTIAKHMGINSTYVHGDYCYMMLRLSRLRDSVKLSPITDGVILSEMVENEVDNVVVDDIESVWNFIRKYGSHYINSYVTGDSLYQVFVYEKSTYLRIKQRLTTRGITNMNTVELANFFGPWYAQHIGKIKVASGNRTLEKWAAKNLKVQYYFVTYPSLLKVHSSVELLAKLNQLMGNEALVEIDMKTMSPAFKEPEKRRWFNEVLVNLLQLYETNL